MPTRRAGAITALSYEANRHTADRRAKRTPGSAISFGERMALPRGLEPLFSA